MTAKTDLQTQADGIFGGLGLHPREGWTIHQEDLAFLSPYMTRTIKRFGDYRLNLGRTPEPWSGEAVLPRKTPQRAEQQGVLAFMMEA